MKEKTVFVVFEGIDGAGKTTLINSLKKYLKKSPEINKRFKNIVFIREPGFKEKKFENQIMKLIFSKESNLNAITKSLLFFVIRSEQIEKTVIPLVKEKNSLIICDRYFLSSLIYQSGMSNINENWIDKTNDIATRNIIPDITFYLTISEKEYLLRLKQKKEKKKDNSFDEIFKNYSMLNNYYEKYIDKYSNKLGNLITLNGEENIKELSKKVLNTIKNIYI